MPPAPAASSSPQLRSRLTLTSLAAYRPMRSVMAAAALPSQSSCVHAGGGGHQAEGGNMAAAGWQRRTGSEGCVVCMVYGVLLACALCETHAVR